MPEVNSGVIAAALVGVGTAAFYLYSNKKKEESVKEESREEDTAGSLKDMANVSAKISTLLDNARNKFEDRYKHVKLRVTLPALLQLMSQAEAKVPTGQEFQRDIVYNKSGSPLQVKPKELEELDQNLNFAEWAYAATTKELEQNLESCGYALLKHETVVEAGSVGYYIAIDPKTKTALIGVKGTSSLADMLTDCCAATTQQTLKQSFTSNKSFQEIRAHEGILISSNGLAKSLKPFVQNVFLPLKYRLLICGHSLGAGAASLTGVLLRSQFPELQKSNRLTVFAYACPPVLNHKAANACTPFITTIVNNSDVITRSSLNNVEVLFDVLDKIQNRLVEAGMNPVDIKSTAAFLSKIKEGSGGEMIMTTEEGFQILDEAQKRVSVDDPDHLYVPGNVILLYRKLQDRKERREALEAIKQTAKGETIPEQEESLPVYGVRTDGIANSLGFIEIDADMVMDHLCSSYHQMVDGLK